MVWRADDEALLERLEDETLAETLLSFVIGDSATHARTKTHPRAGGLVALLRRVPGGDDAVRAALAGDLSRLASFIAALELTAVPPELAHHLALFESKVAVAIAASRPAEAAAAWVRALAGWLALAEQRTYLENLAREISGSVVALDGIVLDVIAAIAKRADESARALLPTGSAALLALGRASDAIKMANASAELARRVGIEATRRRNAAIESAISVVGEALDEAAVRGELAVTGRGLLLQAIPVWYWSSKDDSVEHFVVDRVSRLGWELYRERNWETLRALLEPLRPLFESLASRIEHDDSQLAYAAGCAQMFVFLAEIAPSREQKLELAERSVKICPTHRNGRLVLAAALCEDALEQMQAMVFFAPKTKLDRIEAAIARAASLYPETGDLPAARAMLERVKKSRVPF